MGIYLEDHPPKIRQYRKPRRETPSGVIVVHTAESNPDETAPDTGAESVANFIVNRETYGSYHDLADSDSLIQLVAYDAEAFHDGTGSNPHSYGVSAATMAARWLILPAWWRDRTVRNMARGAARYARWIRTEHGVVIPARQLTRNQSEDRVPGFISHAMRDPARRTDPGATFPWVTFLKYYADELADPTPIPGVDEMEFTDIVPGAIDPDGSPVLVGEALPRGNHAYRSVLPGGALEKRVAVLEARVDATTDARADYAYDAVIEGGLVDQRLDALKAALDEIAAAPGEAPVEARVDAIEATLTKLRDALQ